MKKVAVRVKAVTKSYHQAGNGNGELVHALKGVDLEIYAGELLMIVGPSGSGKTTLLSTIAGVLSFEEGSIEVFGNDIAALSKEELSKFRMNNVGFVFQQFHLLPALNCTENVSLPLLIQGKETKFAEQEAEKALISVGLKETLQRGSRDLSGGQQQRVAIARAIVHAPKLVVCDEPTSNLDAHTGATIMELVKKISEDPERAVIVVTHDPRIFKYASRIVTMDDGMLQKEAITSSPDPQ